MKHTPWKLGEGSWDGTEYWTVEDAKNNIICMAPTKFFSYPECSFIEAEDNKEDGRLIAAAPELLEALEKMVSAFDEWDADEEPPDSPAAVARNSTVKTHRKARAAILKATGGE